MEIFTNLTSCPNCGNYYNADNHVACPICSGNAQPASGIGSFAPTEDPSMAAASGSIPGSFGATVAPNLAQPVQAQPFSATQPVNNPGAAQASSEPFSPTVSIMQAENDSNPQTDPVVGWLVCIDGAVRGNDYRIHAGYNYIGREIGDIHIRGDQTISRQRHAKIAYDPTTHQYFFSPDEGRNLLRVNGKTIMVPVELHNYDVITIGQTKLLFMGLCGEQFSWGQG